MFYDLLSISVFICLPTYIYWYMIITGEQALRWCRRANARARHKGRGSESEKERSQPFETLHRTQVQVSHGHADSAQRCLVVRTFLFIFSFLGRLFVMYAHICTGGGYLGLLNEGAGYSPLRWCAGQMHVHVTRGEGVREREREISTL
jgi:hypothetical protein